MEQNTDEENIIRGLFVSKEKLIERLHSLVSLSKNLIQIVEETGDIYMEDVHKLNNGEKMFLFFLGVYFASKVNLRKTPDISLAEIAGFLSVPQTTVPAPLNKLRKENLVLKINKAIYRLNYDNYKKVKETLLKIKNKNDKKS